MTETIPGKKGYQNNRSPMCWAAFGMMIAFAAATICYSTRLSNADSLLVAQNLT